VQKGPFDLPITSGFEPKETLRTFGEYVLLARLAQGGMGEVFAARKGGGGGLVCVKILREGAAQDATLSRRFANESRLCVSMSHPGICQVVDAGEVHGTRYLVLEYIPGRTLFRLLDVVTNMRRVLPPQLSLSVILDVLDALDYVHHHTDPMSGAPLSIVHKDVSPQNIMLSIHGEVKLIDFGLAQSTLDDAGMKDQVFGKIMYMPPEQAWGAPVDGRADQFAAAAVLLEMLTGERMYPGLSREQMAELPDGYLPPALGALSADVRSILQRALARRPERRYGTCADLAIALRESSLGPSMGRPQLRAVIHGLLPEDVKQVQQAAASWLRKSG
jgi:serine/threonine-protein kinase